MNKIFPSILNTALFITGLLSIIYDKPFLCALCLLAISILFLWTPKSTQAAAVLPADETDDTSSGQASADALQMEMSLRIQELMTSNQLLNEEIERLRTAQSPCPHPLYTCPLTSALPVNLHDFFSSYIKGRFDAVPKNKIHPEYHCSVPDARTYLSAAALTIICDNVVDNMLKFSPDAETVYIRIADMEQDSLIIFKNEGEGISEHETDLIFGLNYQGSNKKSGNGLGLAQVKALVTDFGGQVWAKSSKNTGFALYIRIPEKPGL